MEMSKNHIIERMKQNELMNDETINTLNNPSQSQLNASTNTNVKVNLTKISNSRHILTAGGTLGGLALGRYLCGGILAGVGFVAGGPVGAGLGYEAGVWFGTIAGAACGKKGADQLLDHFHFEGESLEEGETQLHIKTEATRQK